MELQTILEILYKNGLQDVVTRAIQLDQDIPFKYLLDEEVIVEISNSELKEGGIKIKGDRGYGNLKCSIIGIDKWDLKSPYIVRLPHGTIKKVSEERLDDKISSSISEVEAIPSAELPM